MLRHNDEGMGWRRGLLFLDVFKQQVLIDFWSPYLSACIGVEAPAISLPLLHGSPDILVVLDLDAFPCFQPASLLKST